MNNVSLYIHIPFCMRKCLFCSFVIAVGQTHRQEDYVRALANDMKSYEGTTIKTIYLGGGTPSTLDESQLKALFGHLRQTFNIEDSCEITLEANPEDISLEKLSFIKAQGINRLSIGVQSFNDRYLKFLGRVHDSRRAYEAFKLARQIGFKNISGDLMYGFPGQSDDELLSDIQTMVAQEVTHVSLYTLTVEPNSRFYAQAVKLDDNEKLARQYQIIIDQLKSYGYQQYEVSNFAMPGFESKHNTHYWLGGEYIGLGMGAHGYWKGRRYWNHERLNLYLDAIAGNQSPQAGDEVLSEETKLKECLIFGLRMNQGVVEAELLGEAEPLVRSQLQKEIATLIEAKLLTREGDCLKVTDEGRLVLDEIAVRLI